MHSKRLLGRFRANCEGGVLILVGLSFTILVAAGGVAVDLGRQQLVRAKLQQATDAAGLAYEGLPDSATNAQRLDAATRYFTLNFPAVYMGVNRPAIDVVPTGDTVEITTATINMPTLFVRAIGIDSFETRAATTVTGTPGIPQAYDLVLAIDNSSSMAWTDAGCGPGTCPDVSPEKQAIVHNRAVQACRDAYEGYGYTPVVVAGVCNPPASTDAGIPFANKGTISFGLTGGSRLNAVRGAADTIATKLLNPNPTNSRIGVVSWSDGVIGTPLFLTNQYVTVHDTLFSMYALGATNSTAGLGVAQTMAASFDPDHVQAVVLLTDGMNTTVGGLKLSGTGYLDSGNCNGSSAQLCGPTNEASRNVCDALKDRDVQVYTIAFGTEVETGPQATPAQDFLRSCATPDTPGNQHFFIAPDADTLNQAFNNILISLRKIRISK